MANLRSEDFARIIKQRRLSIPLTLSELSARSGVSDSHLSRIEQGERFPSAKVLRKIAQPLGFKESELFMLAGFLTSVFAVETKNRKGYDESIGLDPYVASVLEQEPIEVQRAVVSILHIVRSLSSGT